MSEVTAYHEAGHALLAALNGGRVRQLTIEPDNDDGPARYGDTQVVWRRSRATPVEFAKIAVQVCLAGPVAEMLYTGDAFHPGLVAECAGDWRDAWQAAAPLHADERKRLAYLEQVTRELQALLNREEIWAALAALADELLAHETLEGDDVEAVIRQWLG